MLRHLLGDAGDLARGRQLIRIRIPTLEADERPDAPARLATNVNCNDAGCFTARRTTMNQNSRVRRSVDQLYKATTGELPVSQSPASPPHHFEQREIGLNSAGTAPICCAAVSPQSTGNAVNWCWACATGSVATGATARPESRATGRRSRELLLGFANGRLARLALRGRHTDANPDAAAGGHFRMAGYLRVRVRCLRLSKRSGSGRADGSSRRLGRRCLHHRRPHSSSGARCRRLHRRSMLR